MSAASDYIGNFFFFSSRRRHTRYQQEMESKDRIVVGVNKYKVEEKMPIDTLKIDTAAQRRQVDRLNMVRKTRNESKEADALQEQRKTFQDDKANSMYPIIRAVRG